MECFTTNEVAKKLKISISTVKRLCIKGAIPACRDVISENWEIPKSWFDTYYAWLIYFCNGTTDIKEYFESVI